MGKKKRRSLESTSIEKKARVDHVANLDAAIKVLEVISMRPAIFEDVQMKGFRQAVWPLMERQRHQHFEPRLDKPALDGRQIMIADNINGTIALADYCNQNAGVFESVDMKAFRRALHPLVIHFFRKDSSKNGNNGENVRQDMKRGVLLSALFKAKKFKEALEHIRSWTQSIVRSDGDKEELEDIKLGSMQRWVRHASIEKNDWTKEEDSGEEGARRMSILLLDALLRLVAAYRGTTGSEENKEEGIDCIGDSTGRVIYHEPFTVGSSAAPILNTEEEDSRSTRYTYSIVHTQKGTDR